MKNLLVKLTLVVFSWIIIADRLTTVSIAQEPSNSVVMDSKYRQILDMHCLKCHDERNQKGKFRLDNLPFKISDIETAERWQKTNAPSQLGKSQPSPAPNQPSGLNELFRPQPNGINPFDATRQTQASAPQLVADWPTRIETMALMGSLPLLGLIGVLLFARHIRNLERSEAEAIAAEKARAEEERHRARRRGKGIPMRRLR